jgi:hypothetical protein
VSYKINSKLDCGFEIKGKSIKRAIKINKFFILFSLNEKSAGYYSISCRTNYNSTGPLSSP